VATAHDPVQPEAVEAQPEHHLGRLRGQAPSLVLGVEDEPDLALAVLPAQPLQAHLPDHPADLPPDDREDQAVALLLERGQAKLAVEVLLDLYAVAGIPVEV